jgi:hypothetical protein
MKLNNQKALDPNYNELRDMFKFKQSVIVSSASSQSDVPSIREKEKLIYQSGTKNELQNKASLLGDILNEIR